MNWHLTTVISWSQTNTTVPLLSCHEAILHSYSQIHAYVLYLIHCMFWLPACFAVTPSIPGSMTKRGSFKQNSFQLALQPKLKKTGWFPAKSLNCHFYPNTSPTSSDLLEQLLPGNDPAQPVPRASAVMVHSQVDVLSLRGHTPKTLAACGLWELTKHNWNTVPQTSPWPLADAHSPTHSPTNRKLHIQAQRA